VGKILAVVLLVLMGVWLAPMCSRLPVDLSTQSAPPAPVIAPAPVAEPVAAPAPVPEPPAPAPKREPQGNIGLATFRVRAMFPVENEKYVISILRANSSDEDASGARMTLTARRKGTILERSESGPGQKLRAGSKSYFGLPVATTVIEELLDAPYDDGTGLEWSLTYRLAGDAPGETRCYRLKALPRRRGASGVEWVPQGESHVCAP